MATLQEEINKKQATKKDLEYQQKGQLSLLQKLQDKKKEIDDESDKKQEENGYLMACQNTAATRNRELSLAIQSSTELNQQTMDQITETKADKKKVEISIKQVKKKYNDAFQEFTNMEKETRALQTQIQELTMMCSGVVKMTNELHNEYKKLNQQVTNLQEEQMI